jgi:hypothetical protein
MVCRDLGINATMVTSKKREESGTQRASPEFFTNSTVSLNSNDISLSTLALLIALIDAVRNGHRMAPYRQDQHRSQELHPTVVVRFLAELIEKTFGLRIGQ